MSPSAYLTKRETGSGPRWIVRFRVGGRYTKLVHAGSFKTRKDALARRDFVISELAAGRDPRATLAALQHTVPLRVLRDDYQSWLDSRRDLSAASMDSYTSAMRALPGWLMEMGTGDVSFRDLQRAFDGLSGREPDVLHVGEVATSRPLSPRTLQTYRQTLAQVFDYADIQPNPARDRRFKLPKVETVEPAPPPAAHVLAMLERLSDRMQLPFVLLEQTGARVQEIATLQWGDVDVIGNRLRVTRSTSKTGRARWLQVQPWLMGMIAVTVAPEDRVAARRVFDFTPAGLRSAMAKACVHAQITHYHPHDLRHRRISLWHGQGLPWREISERVGQSRPSITLDVYSHVMPLDEITMDGFTGALR